MARVIFFLIILFAPVIFGWWIFFPLALLSVIITKIPYEIILAGAILDLFFYFGDGLFRQNILFVYSVALLAASVFVEKKFVWKKYF
jgi:hypothetical protein